MPVNEQHRAYTDFETNESDKLAPARGCLLAIAAMTVPWIAVAWIRFVITICERFCN